jgi:hypothetical protein
MITETEIKNFCVWVQEYIDTHTTNTSPVLMKNGRYQEISYSLGKKYAKIITQIKTNSTLEFTSSQRSVYCFVDMTSGNILKPDSWKTPSKHSRGHISNPAEALTPYGVKYL